MFRPFFLNHSLNYYIMRTLNVMMIKAVNLIPSGRKLKSSSALRSFPAGKEI